MTKVPTNETLLDQFWVMKRGGNVVWRGPVIVSSDRSRFCFDFDLAPPGTESKQRAMARFLAESEQLVARARQYWRTDKDETRNADFQIFAVSVAGPAGQPTEPDHSLVWMAPDRAVSSVRHEAHAWALRTYLNPRAI